VNHIEKSIVKKETTMAFLLTQVFHDSPPKRRYVIALLEAEALPHFF